MRMATLSVPLPASEVIRRYNRQLRDNGILPLYSEALGKDGPKTLLFKPSDSTAIRSIIVFDEGNMSTVVFSVGDPSHMLDGSSSIPTGIPHPDGIQEVIVDESRDGATRQTDIAYSWPKHDIPEAKQYYGPALMKSGFRSESSPWNVDSVDKWHQTFSRGAENLRLTLDKQDSSVRVSVLWVHT